jgi:hypothetical protein
MERFKQTIASLEKEVAELKECLKSIKGCPPSVGDIHYAAASQEYGEYSLEELDTFRFHVQKSPHGQNSFQYLYILTNPTAELGTYLQLQGKQFATNWINVEPDKFESYCMEKGGAPFTLTKEIRKCLESKLWEFARAPSNTNTTPEDPTIPKEFSTEITIPFKHTYTILPHISYYLSPFANRENYDIFVEIKEITTKQVIFKINYGNNRNPYKKGYDESELKLHYCIQGVVEQAVCDTLLS